MRKVEVWPYHEQWASLFEEEANKLRDVFGQRLLAIYHIGSTSVPGLAAKPIIDMMPVVDDINAVDVGIGDNSKNKHSGQVESFFPKSTIPAFDP